jgi:glycosyltransferase involved in cell wall biosynthesis
MNVIIISNYYPPELGAASNRISNLANGLSKLGFNVNVICPLPNYPKGEIFSGYKSSFYKKENSDKNLTIHRFWIYPSVSKNPIMRILSMSSFAISLWSSIFFLKKFHKTDWAIIQNSPLLVSFSSILLFGKIFKIKIALNVSDLWPLSALELGAINRGRFYQFLEYIEKFNHSNSDLILGQSQEILDHALLLGPKPTFLYRNFQKNINSDLTAFKYSRVSKKIIYAGLLGVAQGIYEIISKINFSKYNVEFHIYGDGNEKKLIEHFILQNPNRGIFFNGTINKSEIDEKLRYFDASIVPLVKEIKGAVPSKIFELAQHGVPIIFAGGGEGAILIEKHGLGFNVPPGDYIAMEKMIEKFCSLTELEIEAIRSNCIVASKQSFDFDLQLKNLADQLIKLKH